jgi:hypothetical protein
MAPVSPRTQCLAAKEESGKYQKHYIRSFLMEGNCPVSGLRPIRLIQCLGIYNHLPRATYLNRLQSNQNMPGKYLCSAAVTAAKHAKRLPQPGPLQPFGHPGLG